jgi:phospholipid/cholesterol/gamma-HCH transport system substrate-binding protein
MATARTKFSVGLFVVAGLTLSVVVIIALGVTQFLDRGSTYVTFFDESVQGLNVDSPVKYRGVPIGRVRSIQVAPDSRLIQVVMDLDKGVTIRPDSQAQLSAVGITGSMFVNIDIQDPARPPQSPTIDFPTEYPVIPSTPSNIAQVMNSLSVLYHRLLEVDLKGIADRVKTGLDHFNTAMEALSLPELSRDIRTTLQGITALTNHPGWKTAMTSTTNATRAFEAVMHQTGTVLAQASALIARTDQLIAQNQPTLNATLRQLHQTVQQTSVLVTQGTAMIEGSRDNFGVMQKHLVLTLRNLDKASQGLNRLLEELIDQPSRLITSPPPLPRPLP